jgi:hypothetical protein
MLHNPFRKATQETQRQEPSPKQTTQTLALKTVTIVAATVTLFYKNLTQIFTYASQNKTAVYILAVPIVFLYLTYRKRKMLRAVAPLDSHKQPGIAKNTSLIAGILVAATAILLYLQGSYTHTPLEIHNYTFAPPNYHILAMPIFAAGLILILFNSQTLKQLALPTASLFFLTPPSNNTQATALLAGLILLSAGATIYLLASGRGLKNILTKNPDTCPHCAQEAQSNKEYCRECGRILNPANTKIRKTDIMTIALILLIAAFFLAIQSPAFAINKSTRIIVSNTPISLSAPFGLEYSNILPNETSQYTLSTSTEVPYLEGNGTKPALIYTYKALSNESLHDVNVGIDLSSAQSTPVPYVVKPPSIQLNSVSVELNDDSGSPTQAQYFLNERTDEDILVTILYWHVSSAFITNQTVEQKQVTIQLSINNVTQDQLPEAQQQLGELATQINNYWLPSGNLPQTTAHFLSQNGLNLSAAFSAALVATAIYYAAETRKRSRRSLIAISKLNTLDAAIVKALRTTSKPATLMKLAETLQKNTGQNMPPEQLETQLRELEKLGIIRSQVSSQNNTPIQTWKT